MSHRFIICGASRSGKSILARRLQKKLAISWILGDAMVSGLEDAFPDLAISHQGDLQHIGDRLAEYIKFLLWHYDYAGCGYVFDSTHLYPRHVLNIREKVGAVPAVFLGFAEAHPKQKLLEIRRFDPAQNWWTAELSDNELMQMIHDQINKSRELRESCADFDIPYIEVSQDFERALQKAEKILGVGAGSGPRNGAGTTRTVLRPARPEDFDYCAHLYFEGMESIIKELNLNMNAQIAGFCQRWDVTQVRIITLDGTDIGWLQSFIKDDSLFLAQLFVDSALRRRGFGTEVVKGLIKEAARDDRPVTLGVVKTNPALRLYERLGFRTTHEDERKFYMRRD